MSVLLSSLTDQELVAWASAQPDQGNLVNELVERLDRARETIKALERDLDYVFLAHAMAVAPTAAEANT